MIKNHFPKYWVVASRGFLVHKKYTLNLLWDENFFSLFRSNRVSKNPFFHTDFKNVHLTLVKSAPKKSHMYIFEISTKRRIAPFDLFKEKKFSSLRRDNELFWELKKVKNGQNRSKFRKTVFYKQILDFQCPSNILCHTSNFWNFVKITGPTVQWFHSQADLIWPDGPFNNEK